MKRPQTNFNTKAMSVPKVIKPKRSKCFEPLKSRARQNFGAGLQRYYSPADWATKLFKPSSYH